MMSIYAPTTQAGHEQSSTDVVFIQNHLCLFDIMYQILVVFWCMSEDLSQDVDVKDVLHFYQAVFYFFALTRILSPRSSTDFHSEPREFSQ